jgi:hypothetical protein
MRDNRLYSSNLELSNHLFTQRNERSNVVPVAPRLHASLYVCGQFFTGIYSTGKGRQSWICGTGMGMHSTCREN